MSDYIDLGEVLIKGQGSHGIYVQLTDTLGVKLYNLEDGITALGEFAILCYLQDVNFVNRVYGFNKVKVSFINSYRKPVGIYYAIFMEHIDGKPLCHIRSGEFPISSDYIDTKRKEMLSVLKNEYGIDSNDHVMYGENIFLDNMDNLRFIDFSFAYHTLIEDGKIDFVNELLEDSKEHMQLDYSILTQIELQCNLKDDRILV